MGKSKKSEKPLELYTDKQRETVESHIEKYFGEIRNVFSEKSPEHLKLNINVIPPSRKNPYYTLVTCGMGAHIMNTPDELKEKHLERAELVLCLPPDWDFDKEELEYYWPLKLLSLLSTLPIEEDAWLGWGHTIDYGTNFADNTEFCGTMIIYSMFEKESVECELSDDEKVWFYQVLPLYRKELEFKHRNGASALIGKFTDEQLTVADIERPCVVSDNFRELLDTVEEHSSKVTEKNLDILEINGANHIAAFLRWSLEHNLLNDDFLDFFAEDIEQIQSGKYDIRKFLINSLGGELTTDIYTDEGRRFCEYYYDHYHGKNEPCYPRDVDRMAEDYFGTERYNSDEFSNEAYLFVPFDENYYEAISEYIDENFDNFLESLVIDRYIDHASKIDEKGLDTDRLNPANHIVAFLLWSIEHNLMSENFMEFYADFKEDIESGKLGIREFFTDNLDGEFTKDMLSAEGEAFAHFYYSFDCPPPSYPDDVDKMAEAYFGTEKYNSEEFQDEAYLFVPFNKKYVKAMAKCIDRAYADFRYFIENGKLPDEE